MSLLTPNQRTRTTHRTNSAHTFVKNIRQFCGLLNANQRTFENIRQLLPNYTTSFYSTNGKLWSAERTVQGSIPSGLNVKFVVRFWNGKGRSSHTCYSGVEDTTMVLDRSTKRSMIDDTPATQALKILQCFSTGVRNVA